MKYPLFILVLFSLYLSPFTIPYASAATINLPATGQTTCYQAVSPYDEIPCAGTGQDGDKKMGVPVDDAGRFTNNGNGTITDNLTGLIWLQNANCTATVGGITKTTGYLTWNDALTWSNNLASGACGLTDGSSAGQWRLPTRKELLSLVNRGVANSAAWLGTKGFSSVQAIFYWSCSSHAYYGGVAWYVTVSNGDVNYRAKDPYTYSYVWPVRGGQ